MISRNNLFFISLSFILALLLVSPLQMAHADDATTSDASSTPVVDISTPADNTPIPDTNSEATSSTPIIVTTATTTPATTVEASTTPVTDAPVADTNDASSTSTIDLSSPTAPDVASSTPTAILRSVTINLDVESASSTLFKGPITVNACSPFAGATTTVNEFCAYEQAGLSPLLQSFSFGEALVSLTGIGDWNTGPRWSLFSNNQSEYDSVDQHILTPNENILATVGPMPLLVTVANPSLAVGATTTVNVEGFSDISYDYEPISGATILGTSASVTDADGNAVITATSTNAFSVSASATGFLPSNSVLVSPTAPVSTPTTPIASSTTGTAHITIRDGATVAWSGLVSFPIGTSTIQIAPTGSTTSYTVQKQSLLGALENLESSTTTFSLSDLQYYPGYDEFYINCIAIPGASLNDCGHWQYQVNGGATFDSIDGYDLQNGDNIYLYYGSPRVVTVATSTVTAGDSFTATAQSYDPSTNTFSPIVGEIIAAAIPDPTSAWDSIEIATSTTDSNGQASFTLTTPATYGLGFESDGYYPTVLTVTAAATSTTTTPTAPSGGSGGGGSHSSQNVSSAFAYLVNQQQADGSIGDSRVSDWAALAFALGDAPSSAHTKLATYIKTETPTPLSAAIDYERHAIALMSFGINPYSGTGVDYIAPIVAAFDGTQIGAVGEDNDDIFGIIALSKAGYTSSDSVIKQTITSIVGEQHPDGSWDESVDMTGAAMQALSQFSSLSGVPGSLVKAESYLRANQQADGGFGDSFSTSWDLIGIAAQGESVSNWSLNGKTPVDSLSSLQNSDGSVQVPYGNDTNNLIWATATALPAFEGRSWTSLMQSYSKPAGASSGGGSSATSTLATTTASTVATSTSPIASSTPMLIVTPIIATTTPVTETPIHHVLTALSAADTVHAPMATSSISLEAAASASPTSHTILDAVMNFFAWFNSILSRIF